MRILFSWVFVWLALSASAFNIHGVVSGANNERLGYSNIFVKGTTNGTSANATGQYQLDLPAGTYELIFQHLGFKQHTETVTVKADLELNVTLEPQQYEIRDVVVNGSEDPALEVIRKAIQKRKYFLNVVESYSCDAYVKGLQRILEAPDRILGRKLNTGGLLSGPKNSGIIYLSESQSKLYYKKPDKFREVIYSSKVSGRANGFTFNSAQNFYFNFYERNITIPFIAQRPFISPLSENTFFYYNFHMLGAYKEGEYLVNKILVTPKRKADPCFTGVLSIVENNWNIHSLELYLTKINGIQYIDTLKVTQYFVPVAGDIWLPTQQRYDANGGALGIKGEGYYLGIFKNYVVNDIKGMIPPATKAAIVKADSVKAPKKYAQQLKKAEKKAEKQLFTSEVLKVEEQANKREEAYWDSIRPVPLTELETNDYQLKDSIQIIRDSKEFKDSTDKDLNKPGFFSILTGYTYRKQFKKIQVDFPSLLNLVNYNTVEGLNLQMKFAIRKDWKKNGMRLVFEPWFRFGVSNLHFNSMAKLTLRTNQVHEEFVTLSGGKYVSQFNEIQPQSEFGNTWQSLIFKQNYMKLFEQYFARVSYSRELYNGITGSFTAHYAHRMPLENMNHFSFFKSVKGSYTRNGMDLPETNSLNYNIQEHNILRIEVKLHFVFGQKYITRPDSRFRTGSKWPELLISYKRGIPIKGFSDVNYDFLEAQLEGTIPLKLAGTMFYRFGGGGFPYSKNVPYTDYKHFYGNFMVQGTTDLLGFFLLRYYRHSTTKYFAEGHIEHHFGGFLFNKIPGIRTLKLDEVVGFHFLYTPTRQQWLQVDVGIANILKVLRVDFVAGFGSQKKEQYYGGRVALALSVFR